MEGEKGNKGVAAGGAGAAQRKGFLVQRRKWGKSLLLRGPISGPLGASLSSKPLGLDESNQKGCPLPLPPLGPPASKSES